MRFLILLTNAKTAYSAYKTINDIFVDKTKEVMQAIGKKELQSAIKTLEDIRHSNDKNREFASAITQLRLAMEKMDAENANKWKTALLLALCYKVLNENILSERFGESAKEYFTKYIEGRRRWCLCVAKDQNREMLLGEFKRELEDAGVNHNDKEPNLSFWEALWKGYNATERIENVARESRRDFSMTVNRLLTL